MSKLVNAPYPLYDTRPNITDLKDLINQRLGENPDGECFSWQTGKTVHNKTAREFAADVNAFGTFLVGMKLQDAHLAVLGENSYNWLVAFMAAAIGSGAAVPVDRDLPAEKTQGLVRKADCAAAIASPVCAKKLADMEGVTVLSLKQMPDYIEKGQALLDAGERRFVDCTVNPDDIAAIFFTSGTTGDHKGVVLTHKNIAFDIVAASKNFLLEGNRRTVSVLPFHHSFGLVTAVLKVFYYNGFVFINDSIRYVQRDMQNVKPETMFFVPLYIETFYKRIMANVRKQGKEKKLRFGMKLSDFLLEHFGVDKRGSLFAEVQEAFGGELKSIICGGAALDPKYVKIFRTWGITLLNGYGITECAPVVSVNRNLYYRDGSIGLALEGVETKLTEDGELLIRGDNVMQGYYNDPAATAAVLSDGWYASGDLCRIDEDGFIFITGRKKNLIILSNGENVSPEELEQTLQQDPAVNEVVVFGMSGALAVEFFPEEDHLSDHPYFEQLVDSWNKDQPAYRRIEKVFLRDTEFEKNSTKKILRFKVTEAHNA